MRKNGSRLISFRQYCLTDLFLFAVILVVFELILHFAGIAYGGTFSVSPLLPITILVIMRWGWQGVFFAVGDGLLVCLLNLKTEGFASYFFAVYTIGNAFIMLLLLMTKFMGKERIRGKWYFSVLFVLAGWIAVLIGRVLVFVCFGQNFTAALVGQLMDLLSPAIAVLLVLVMRRLDGMFEDQKHFLLRLDKERKELQRRDEFGDEEIEIDEEALKIIRKDDELYK